MKKVLVAAAMSVVAGFSLAGCGGGGDSDVMTPMLMTERLEEAGIPCTDPQVATLEMLGTSTLTCNGVGDNGFTITVLSPDTADEAACETFRSESWDDMTGPPAAYAANWWSDHGRQSAVRPEDLGRTLDASVGTAKDGYKSAFDFLCN